MSALDKIQAQVDGGTSVNIVIPRAMLRDYVAEARREFEDMQSKYRKEIEELDKEVARAEREAYADGYNDGTDFFVGGYADMYED